MRVKVTLNSVSNSRDIVKDENIIFIITYDDTGLIKADGISDSRFEEIKRSAEWKIKFFGMSAPLAIRSAVGPFSIVEKISDEPVSGQLPDIEIL